MSCIRIKNKVTQQVGVQFYVCLPFLMRGVIGGDFEFYHVLLDKELVANHWRHHLIKIHIIKPTRCTDSSNVFLE